MRRVPRRSLGAAGSALAFVLAACGAGSSPVDVGPPGVDDAAVGDAAPDASTAEASSSTHTDATDMEVGLGPDAHDPRVVGAPARGVCTPGATLRCYDGPPGTDAWGRCKPGTRTCLPDGAGYGPCEGQVLPIAERCDTPDDDDCNGLVNEAVAGCTCLPGEKSPCYPGPYGSAGRGPCTAGEQTCLPSGHGYGACVGAVLPMPTDCGSDVDLDCDGRVYDAEDGCCAPGTWAKCAFNPAACDPGYAQCNADGKTRGACERVVLKAPEDCGDGIDNDCDGYVDEEGPSCVCLPGTLRECYTGPPATDNVGACHRGVAPCDAKGLGWGACTNDVRPAARENCAMAADEDCSGAAATACLAKVRTIDLRGYQSLQAVGHPDGATSLVIAGYYTASRFLVAGSAGSSAELGPLQELATTPADAFARGPAPVGSDVGFFSCWNDNLSFGGMRVDCAGQPAAVAVRYNALGAAVWVRRAKLEGFSIRDAAWTSGGDVVVAAFYTDGSALPGQPLPTVAQGTSGLVLFRMAGGDGQVNVLATRANVDGDRSVSLDAAANGDLALAWGASNAATGGYELKLATFDAGGALKQQRTLGAERAVLPTVRFGPSGDLWLSAWALSNDASLEGATLTAGGGVARYAPSLTPRWATTVAATGALVALPDGRAVVASGAFDYGYAPVGAESASPGLVLLSPTGAVTAHLPVSGHTPTLFMTAGGRVLFVANVYGVGRVGDDRFPFFSYTYQTFLSERLP